MKKWIRAIGVAFIVCFMSWLTGFDFDQRGVTAFSTAYLAISLAVFAYLMP